MQRSSGVGVRLLAQCMLGHRTEGQPASPASANLKRKTKAMSMVHPEPLPDLCSAGQPAQESGGQLVALGCHQGSAITNQSKELETCVSPLQHPNTLLGGEAQTARVREPHWAPALLQVCSLSSDSQPQAPASPQVPLSGSLSPLL